jgi:hypothetical protein
MQRILSFLVPIALAFVIGCSAAQLTRIDSVIDASAGIVTTTIHSGIQVIRVATSQPTTQPTATTQPTP